MKIILTFADVVLLSFKILENGTPIRCGLRLKSIRRGGKRKKENEQN